MVEDTKSNKEQEEREEKEDRRRSFHAKCAAFSEVFFVVLPFLVLFMTLGHRGELNQILFLPEWSIVSTVIIGQTLIRLVAMVLGRKVYHDVFLVFLTALIVFLLVPNVVILTMVLTTEKVSPLLAGTQVAIFIIDAILYWVTLFADSELRAHDRKVITKST